MNIQQAVDLIKDAGPLLPRPGQAQHWADLGCGAGLFTEALVHLLPEASTIHGIDTNPGFRQQATPNNVTLLPLTADFEKDTLPLSNLDGILMANSLHYVKDKPTLLLKLRTYMRAEAPFIIVEYDTDQPVRTWVPYPLSYVSLKKLFTSSGYPSIQKLGERPSAYGRANMYAAIAMP